jgi:hypothetical protein
MSYAKRVDANHSEIVKKFRELGCSVFDTSRVAGGFPDILVGVNHKTALIEIKSSPKAKFTPAQQAFMLNWQGSTVARIDSIEAAIHLVNLLKSG